MPAITHVMMHTVNCATNRNTSTHIAPIRAETKEIYILLTPVYNNSNPSTLVNQLTQLYDIYGTPILFIM